MYVTKKTKTLWTTSITTIVLALLPVIGRAQTTPDPAPNPILDRLKWAACQVGPYACIKDTGPSSGLRQAAQIGGIILGSLLAFLGIVFMVLMVMAGLRWMTARGNEQEVEKAKKTIESAAIGLLIVVLAYALVSLASYIIGKIGLLD